MESEVRLSICVEIVWYLWRGTLLTKNHQHLLLGDGPLKRPKVMEILIACVNDLSPVFFKYDRLKRYRSTPLVFDKGGVCSTLLYSTLLPSTNIHLGCPEEYLTGSKKRIGGIISVFLWNKLPVSLYKRYQNWTPPRRRDTSIGRRES